MPELNVELALEVYQTVFGIMSTNNKLDNPPYPQLYIYRYGPTLGSTISPTGFVVGSAAQVFPSCVAQPECFIEEICERWTQKKAEESSDNM